MEGPNPYLDPPHKTARAYTDHPSVSTIFVSSHTRGWSGNCSLFVSISAPRTALTKGIRLHPSEKHLTEVETPAPGELQKTDRDPLMHTKIPKTSTVVNVSITMRVSTGT